MSIDISNVTISIMSSDTAQVILDIYTNYKCLDKLFIDKYLYMSTDTAQVIMHACTCSKTLLKWFQNLSTQTAQFYTSTDTALTSNA